MPRKSLQPGVAGFLTEDEAAVRAVLEFADKNVTTWDAAVRALAPVIGDMRVDPRDYFPVEDGEPERPAFFMRGWEDVQERLRGWLPKVARFDRLKEPDRIALRLDLIRAWSIGGHGGYPDLGDKRDSVVIGSVVLGATGLSIEREDGHMDLFGERTTRPHRIVWWNCVGAVLPFVFGLRRPAELHRCEAPTCRTWFLRDDLRQRYCCPAHGNTTRVNRFRRENRARAKHK